MKKLILLCLLGGSAFGGKLEELPAVKDFTSFIDDKKAVSAYRDELRKYFGEDNFSCEKFETVQGDLQLLAKKVPGFQKRLWSAKPNYPSHTIVLSEEEEPFTVRPLRAFHAVWFDTKANGCGQTTCELADPNAPERWAALLESGQLFAVERKGNFTGTVYLLVPVQNSTGTWAGVWTRESENVPKEVASAWLEKLRPALPKEWKGVKENFADTRVTDPMANQIALALPRRCFGAKESRGENLLAGLDDRAGEGKSAFFVMNFKDAQAVDELMDTFQSPDSPGRLAELSPKQFQDLKTNLGGVLFSNDSLAKRARAAQALGWLGAPLKKVDLPEMKVSGTPISSRLPSSQVAPLLSKALGDSSPLVRGAAAVNLADMGIQSPAISKAQQGVLDGDAAIGSPSKSTGGGKKGADDPNLLARAAENSLDRGIPLKRGQLDRLFDNAEKLPDGKDKERLLDNLARAYLNDTNPARALQFSHDAFVKNPEVMETIANKINNLSCPKLEQYDKDIHGIEKEIIHEKGKVKG